MKLAALQPTTLLRLWKYLPRRYVSNYYTAKMPGLSYRCKLWCSNIFASNWNCPFNRHRLCRKISGYFVPTTTNSYLTAKPENDRSVSPRHVMGALDWLTVGRCDCCVCAITNEEWGRAVEEESEQLEINVGGINNSYHVIVSLATTVQYSKFYCKCGVRSPEAKEMCGPSRELCCLPARGLIKPKQALSLLELTTSKSVQEWVSAQCWESSHLSAQRPTWYDIMYSWYFSMLRTILCNAIPSQYFPIWYIAVTQSLPRFCIRTNFPSFDTISLTNKSQL